MSKKREEFKELLDYLGIENKKWRNKTIIEMLLISLILILFNYKLIFIILPMYYLFKKRNIRGQVNSKKNQLQMGFSLFCIYYINNRPLIENELEVLIQSKDLTKNKAVKYKVHKTIEYIYKNNTKIGFKEGLKILDKEIDSELSNYFSILSPLFREKGINKNMLKKFKNKTYSSFEKDVEIIIDKKTNSFLAFVSVKFLFFIFYIFIMMLFLFIALLVSM